jgi:2-polyprenyl-6-methoxyphenol hydroxylase-like FAD-dependent oxidoreductase
VKEADADVLVVGAGPTGLMLAAELCLGGVRPLVLERRTELGRAHKANGFGGQILHLLRYRGLLDRFEAASADARPAAVFPFGGVHVDLTGLEDPPLRGMSLPQARLEELLESRAVELGASVLRGHEVLAVGQRGGDEGTVTASVRGPSGAYHVRARYLAGCDGPRSTVREAAGIAFPGTVHPEVNRLAQVAVPDSVTVLDNGDLEVPGLGRIRRGFTRTERGVFACALRSAGDLMLQTTEDDPAWADRADDPPMTVGELQDSIHRVLGGDLPLGPATRLSRYRFEARQAERYRSGRILLAGDAAHVLPATGAAISVGMLDAVNLAWKLAAVVRGRAADRLVDTYHDERHFAGARALRQTQAQVALRRGHDRAADALREVFQELIADEQPARRLAAMISGGDIRYRLPGLHRHPLAGTFAPDLDLRTRKGPTSVAELMHAARPVLLDLADRAQLRDVAGNRLHHLEIVTAETDHRPADALLIRPDAYVAWAAGVDEPADTAVPALREALDRCAGGAGSARV